MRYSFPFAALFAAAICGLFALPLLQQLDERFVEQRPMVELTSLRCESWGYLGPYRLYRQQQPCEWHAMYQRWGAAGLAGGQREVWVRGAMPIRQWRVPASPSYMRRASVPGDEHGILHSAAWKNAHMLLEHDPAGIFSDLVIPRETGAALLANMCRVASESLSEDELKRYQSAAFSALRESSALSGGGPLGPDVLPQPADFGAGERQL